MKRRNIIIILLLITAIVIVIGAKNKKQQQTQLTKTQPEVVSNTNSPTPITAEKKLPRLLELGSVTCIPCKMMAPILDELKEAYAGQLTVTFIDVAQNKNAGTEHNIRVIPTQIFFANNGSEIFRHEGFFAKDDIIRKWKELGYNFTKDPATNKNTKKPEK